MLPQEKPYPHSLRVTVNLVLVPVSVTDALHRPILNLQLHNFELREGADRQQIRFFSQEDEPMSLVLVLDVSGSMGKKIDIVRAAVQEFFINANPQDDYTVVTVSDRPEMLIRASQSIEDILATLAPVKAAGSTALLDSVRVAAMALQHARYERRVILMVSDGLENVSRHHLREVADFIEESGLDVYAIGVKDESLPFFGNLLEERIDKKLLMRITDVTGGHTVVIQSAAELPDMTAHMSQAMRNEYVLGYRPADGAHTRMWRKIKVTVTAPGEPALQTYYKKTYFTPGDGRD